MCHVCGDQKTTLDPLGLELQVAVSHHVGAGNKTIVLSASATDTLNPWVISPAPKFSSHKNDQLTRPSERKNNMDEGQNGENTTLLVLFSMLLDKIPGSKQFKRGRIYFNL